MGLPLKPGQAIRIGGERLGEDLQGDLALKLRISRLIDLPHAALADEVSNFVDAEAGAWVQSPAYHSTRTYVRVVVTPVSAFVETLVIESLPSKLISNMPGTLSRFVCEAAVGVSVSVEPLIS